MTSLELTTTEVATMIDSEILPCYTAQHWVLACAKAITCAICLWNLHHQPRTSRNTKKTITSAPRTGTENWHFHNQYAIITKINHWMTLIITFAQYWWILQTENNHESSSNSHKTATNMSYQREKHSNLMQYFIRQESCNVADIN